MSELIDITPTVSPRLAVFPGDVSYSRDVSLNVESGDNITLSSITTTVHVGAHTDAPNHYQKGGDGIASRALDTYFGPCDVMRVSTGRGQRMGVADLPRAPKTPRVLLHTGTFPNPDDWNGDFAALSAPLVDHLADLGVVLVGIDTPSIDPADDKELEAHTAVARRELAILEGIVLEHVPDGIYTLIALPLKLENADAAPVRAALIAQPTAESV